MRRRQESRRGFELLWESTDRSTYRDGVRVGMVIALRLAAGEEQYGTKGYPRPLEHTEGFTLWMDEVLDRLGEAQNDRSAGNAPDGV